MPKLYHHLVILAVIATPIASAVEAKGRPHAASSSAETLAINIRKLAIAGVYWGQRDNNAMQALRANGFDVPEPDLSETKSFDEQVQDYLDHPERIGHWEVPQRPGGTYEIRATKENETVKVEFISFPDGWRVHYVRYDYSGGKTPYDLWTVAKAKYAQLGLEIIDGDRSLICVSNPVQCEDTPYISTYHWGEFNMILRGGDRGGSSEDKPFQDAVAERKGRTAPSF